MTLLAIALAFALGPGPSQHPALDALHQTPFFEAILGAWTGEGELFGQPTEFDMTWREELGGRFVRLEYSILGDRGMDAIAHYRAPEAESSTGVWVDTRGEILELSATVTETALETIWRSPTEQGRTTYTLAETGELEVVDYFYDGQDWQRFARAVYTRER